MSAPAAKAFSLPVSTMQPIAGSSSAACRACPNSRASCAFNALSAFGRLSVMSATAPLFSAMMVSYAIGRSSLPKNLSPRLTLVLAARTIEGGASALRDAPDAARSGLGPARKPALAGVAIAARTRFTFLVVDSPAVLEIAELARGLDIVAQARAAVGDGVV